MSEFWRGYWIGAVVSAIGGALIEMLWKVMR